MGALKDCARLQLYYQRNPALRLHKLPKLCTNELRDTQR